MTAAPGEPALSVVVPVRDDSGSLSEWFFSEYIPRREEPSLAPTQGVGSRPAQDVRNQLF